MIHWVGWGMPFPDQELWCGILVCYEAIDSSVVGILA